MLWEIEQFLRATGMTESRFGLEVANDKGLVRTLRNGREPRPPMAAKIVRYIAAQRAVAQRAASASRSPSG